MADYYQTFCKNFSTVVSSDTSLLSLSKPIVSTLGFQHAFDSVKAMLCDIPLIAAPGLSKPFKIEVDASAVGAGVVLLQEDPCGIGHPVSYFSWKFNKHYVA